VNFHRLGQKFRRLKLPGDGGLSRPASRAAFAGQMGVSDLLKRPVHRAANGQPVNGARIDRMGIIVSITMRFSGFGDKFRCIQLAHRVRLAFNP
jgi:hypothetical protein